MRMFSSIVFAAVVAAPVFAGDITVETAVGAATVPANPAKTAVFDMSALDNLDALGVEGLTSISNTFLPYLESYQGEIGTIFEPDFEYIAGNGFDLVVAGGRSSRQVETLSKIAPTVDMTIWGEGHLDQSRSRLTALASIFGKEEQGAAMIDTLNAEIEATKAALEGKGNALILLTNGGKVSAYGAKGRFGWLHTELGLPEVMEDVEEATHGEPVSFEFILEANPDWVLVLDRAAAIGAEGESAEATLNNAIFAQTAAAQKGQVIHLNSGAFYIAGGGYQSILETLSILKESFSAGS